MNQNLIIGLLVAVIVVGGGAWLYESGSVGSGTATSTPTTANNEPANVAAAPVVTTGTLVVASNASAVMTGKVFPNGSQTSYWYEYGTTSALGTKTNSQAVGSGFVNISAPQFITGLSANTNYYFRLVAENVFGSTNGTVLSFSTNDNPPLVGNAPTTHTDAATSIARTNANLNGHLTPSGSDTSFWFEYGETNNLGNTTSFQSAGAGTGSVAESVSVSNLKPATKYYFRMNAQNQFGTVNGAIISFTTSGPATASAPSANTTSATNIRSTSATLDGQVNPNGDSTSYWFEYSTDTLLGSILGSTTHKVAVSGSGTSQVNVSTDVSNLVANTTYGYRLVTMNTYGTTRGNIVTFKTKTR